MRTGNIRFRRGILLTAVFACTLPLAAMHLLAQTADLNKIRSIAEAQHDIVIILIKKKEFAKAEEEANKIFQMNWPNDQEHVLLKELLGFSDLFRHNNQPALALQLIDANLNLFKASQNQAEIWKDKGYLLELMGQHDKALECFRKAKSLLEVKKRP